MTWCLLFIAHAHHSSHRLWRNNWRVLLPWQMLAGSSFPQHYSHITWPFLLRSMDLIILVKLLLSSSSSSSSPPSSSPPSRKSSTSWSFVQHISRNQGQLLCWHKEKFWYILQPGARKWWNLGAWIWADQQTRTHRSRQTGGSNQSFLGALPGSQPISLRRKLSLSLCRLSGTQP